MNRSIACVLLALVATCASANPGSLVALQMADGSRLFRFAYDKKLADALIVDQIAQRLAERQWCPNGWEETGRNEPTRGITVIEGRCK